MTTILNSRYKILKQSYTDVWNNGKKGVKVLKKIQILNILLFCIEKKKNALREVFIRQAEKGKQPKWAKINNIVNTFFYKDFIASVLKKIPGKYMNRNTKTRIYKYCIRRHKQLFKASKKIFSMFLYIVERKRKKPDWRKTQYNLFLQRKQLLHRYYGNFGLRWLRTTVRKNKFHLFSPAKKVSRINQIKRTPLDFFYILESRLDSVLVRSKLVVSPYQARQLILHGKVFVNNKKITAPSFLLKKGDVISWDSSFFRKNNFYFEKMNHFLYTCISTVDTNILNKFTKKNNKIINSSFFFQNEMSDLLYFLKNQLVEAKYIENSILSEGFLNQVSSSHKRSWDLIESILENQRFFFTLEQIPEHLLFSEKMGVVIYLDYPNNSVLPFGMNESDFRILYNYLRV